MPVRIFFDHIYERDATRAEWNGYTAQTSLFSKYGSFSPCFNRQEREEEEEEGEGKEKKNVGELTSTKK